MTTGDIIILIILALGAWSGYRKGFLLALVSVAAIVLGVFGGFKLMDNGVKYLQREFHIDAAYLPYLSFLLIFIIISVLVRVFGNLLRSSIQKTIFGEADKALGAVLGLVKYAFTVSILLWLAVQLEVEIPPDWTKDSILIPALSGIVPWLGEKAGEWLPFFKDLAGKG